MLRRVGQVPGRAAVNLELANASDKHKTTQIMSAREFATLFANAVEFIKSLGLGADVANYTFATVKGNYKVTQ